LVDAVVGFADDGGEAIAPLLPMALDDVEGVVGGGSVDDEVFNLRIGLRKNAFDGLGNGGFGIATDGDDGDFHGYDRRME